MYPINLALEQGDFITSSIFKQLGNRFMQKEPLPTYLESNKAALKRVQSYEPSKTLIEQYSDNPNDLIFSLRLNGFKCWRCGGKVTGQNFAFSGYSEKTACYSCSRNFNA